MEDSQYQGDDSLLILHVLLPHHGVGLAGARLTVSKDADVVALEGVQQHLLSDVFVNFDLRGVVGVLGLRTETTMRHVGPGTRPWNIGIVTEVWDQ